MTIERNSIPSYRTVETLKESLVRKDQYKPSDQYPSDGTWEHAFLEGQFAMMVGIEEENLLSYHSGMSAVIEAIEIGYPTAGTVVAFGDQLYGHSSKFISEQLSPRKVRAVAFNSGSIEDIDRILKRYNPEIIVAETVANGPGMPVLDVENFLELPSLRQNNPLIILDETLTTPSNLSLVKFLKEEPGRRILVAESGTKSLGLNSDLIGLIYGKNSELLQALRIRRRTTRSLPCRSVLETMRKVMPSSKEEFDHRNRLICTNTFRLARVFENGCRGRNDLIVSYPNLSSHPNFEYASRIFPEGATLVFFIQSAGKLDQWELIHLLWDRSAIIREHCELGQSFGFDKTRIGADTQSPVVRIAGGTEDRETIEILLKEFTAVLQTS